MRGKKDSRVRGRPEAEGGTVAEDSGGVDDVKTYSSDDDGCAAAAASAITSTPTAPVPTTASPETVNRTGRGR